MDPAHPFILVTGATGFVGRALCPRLVDLGYRVRAAVRNMNRDATPSPAVERCLVGEIDAHTSWHDALRDVGAVVHLASGTSPSAAPGASMLERYRTVNLFGTQALAAAAIAAGVRQLIFVSTIKVNGERTLMGQPFREADAPLPEDAYGQSKWEAEQMLKDLVAGGKMSVTILRPPLVYGPGVKGNFLAMMNALHRGLPLPLASVRNLRSLIFLGNFVDAIIACAEAPAAAGKTYLVSDGMDVSTPELLRALAAALGTPARLVPCPVALIRSGASLLGKRAEIGKILDSLQVDNSRIRDDLGWRPSFSLSQGLEETARWYRARAGVR